MTCQSKTKLEHVSCDVVKHLERNVTAANHLELLIDRKLRRGERRPPEVGLDSKGRGDGNRGVGVRRPA